MRNKHTHTNTHTQLFYDSLYFIRDNLGEPVPEETFTHSHLSWSSIVSYLLHPSNTIHGILYSLFNPRAWQLSVWGEMKICIWPSRCHCHSLSLGPVNPDWFYLPGFTFLVPAHLGIPVKIQKSHQTIVCVCVCVFKTAKVTFSLTQCHWQSCHLIGHTWFPITLPVTMFLSCTISKILSIISQNLKVMWCACDWPRPL